MIIKETDGMENYVIIDFQHPLPMEIGDMSISRADLKKRYCNPPKNNKTEYCWHTYEKQATDAAVELLGLMWMERGVKKKDKGGEES